MVKIEQLNCRKKQIEDMTEKIVLLNLNNKDMEKKVVDLKLA